MLSALIEVMSWDQHSHLFKHNLNTTARMSLSQENPATGKETNKWEPIHV